ncbi:MAG: hypothetical protein ACPG52_12290 [Cognaticolwellia sp.]
MTLFSWFIKRNKANATKNNKIPLEPELPTYNNNTMWPTAKVRSNTVVQQKEYVNVVSNLKKETKVNVLKERTSET